jgi:hypothetical protein
MKILSFMQFISGKTLDMSYLYRFPEAGRYGT